MCGVHLWGGAVSLKYGIHTTETWATMLAGNILRLLQDFRSQESKVQLPSVSLFSLVPTPNPLSWGKQPHPQLKAAILVSHLVCEWEENSRSCWVGHEEDVAQTWILHRELEQIPWCWHKVFLFLYLWNTKYLTLWNQPFLPFNKIKIIVLSSLDSNSAFTIHPICTWTEKDSESYES